MELELISKVVEQGLSVWLLLVFVYFFLTKFYKAQEEMLKMLAKQTSLIEKLINRVDEMIRKDP